MKREIVKIDEEKCTGCGSCIPNCHEGALQIIDNKAVLVSELMCDGLGACIGHCLEGALEIEIREAENYSEERVMEEMISKGKNVVTAHLKHLKDHREFGYLKQGVAYLMTNQIKANFDVKDVIQEVHNSGVIVDHSKLNKQQTDMSLMHHSGCPGSQSRSFEKANNVDSSDQDTSSALTQWPVQMHLINPTASYFQGANLLVAADCVAFALGNFHSKFLSGKKLVIACPKLDSNKEVYVEKMIRLINDAKVNTITVMIMEVPCCGGLLQLVMNALQSASRKVPVKAVTVSIQGEILSEEWI